jgi:hypothetical protein
MEVGILTVVEELSKPNLDTSTLLADFAQDCLDRHLTEETIGRYKSPLKVFFVFLQEKGRTVLDVDKHVLKDFIHFRRSQGVDQKTLENNFTALSTFYEFLCFEGHTNANPVLPVRKRYLKRYKDAEGDEDGSVRKLVSVEDMAMLVNSPERTGQGRCYAACQDRHQEERASVDRHTGHQLGRAEHHSKEKDVQETQQPHCVL